MSNFTYGEDEVFRVISFLLKALAKLQFFLFITKMYTKQLICIGYCLRRMCSV